MKRLFNTRWGLLPKGAENHASNPENWWTDERGAWYCGLWERRWWRIYYLAVPPADDRRKAKLRRTP